ncbi:hypothetical protein PSP6_270114 [Paraburkholderia tropica]|nr:hypothetical protein PSP6_270114 [Paraburkholderia tropica]
MLADSLDVSPGGGGTPRAAPLPRLYALAHAARAVVPVAHARRVPAPAGRQRRAELVPGFAGEEHRLTRAAAPHDCIDLVGAKRLAQRINELADLRHWPRGSVHGRK